MLQYRQKLRKEVKTLSKPKRKKKSSYQIDRTSNIVNLVAAILNLIAVILVIIEKILK